MGAFDGFAFSDATPADNSGWETVDLSAYTPSATWDNGGLSLANYNYTAAPSSPTVNTNPQTLTAGTFMNDLTGGFNSVAGLAKDVMAMKTTTDSLKLQNNSANLQYRIADLNANTQAQIAAANLAIASDKMQTAEVQANTSLGIARLQSQATLQAVQQNPLASQFVTGKGLLGNLSADGKVSLLIGLVTVWLMVRRKHG